MVRWEKSRGDRSGCECRTDDEDDQVGCREGSLRGLRGKAMDEKW